MARPKLEYRMSDRMGERVARIKAMRLEGYTYLEIGQELGVTRQAVQGMAVRYRVEKHPAELGRRKCLVCSASFTPRMKTQRCCSSECGTVRCNLLHGCVSYFFQPCDECGTSFQPKSKRNRFCSARCNWTKKNREYRRLMAAKGRAEVVDCDR